MCEAIFAILGNPDVFCIAGNRAKLPLSMQNCSFTTSFIQHIPGSQRWYRHFVALFPLAVELLDLRGYDLVVSSDAATMKGIVTAPQAVHICYCHSPMRYAWHMFHEYRAVWGFLPRSLFSVVMHYLRIWDHGAAQRVDYFAANSQTVRERIRKFYGREATVIYPPCDLERFEVGARQEDYYLFVGRLVRYKRADLAIQVFGENGKRLLVVGEGPEEKALKRTATKKVEFLGRVGDEELAQLYSRCKAVVFPGEEDFGIVPVEAQAAGRPVIAYGRGGASETVLPGRTGVLFHEPTAESLDAAVQAFEAAQDSFDPMVIRQHAEQFGANRFRAQFEQFLSSCLDDREIRRRESGRSVGLTQ
ncbi:MAG: glycosyltransferase [Desulfomonile tiedjei]|nr:glycosyltransferase [Desulfomonile tiedjei]